MAGTSEVTTTKARPIVGQWYRISSGKKFLCISMQFGGKFVGEDGMLLYLGAYELEHLEGCGSFDWEPEPKPSDALLRIGEYQPPIGKGRGYDLPVDTIIKFNGSQESAKIVECSTNETNAVDEYGVAVDFRAELSWKVLSYPWEKAEELSGPCMPEVGKWIKGPRHGKKYALPVGTKFVIAVPQPGGSANLTDAVVVTETDSVFTASSNAKWREPGMREWQFVHYYAQNPYMIVSYPETDESNPETNESPEQPAPTLGSVWMDSCGDEWWVQINEKGFILRLMKSHTIGYLGYSWDIEKIFGSSEEFTFVRQLPIDETVVDPGMGYRLIDKDKDEPQKGDEVWVNSEEKRGWSWRMFPEMPFTEGYHFRRPIGPAYRRFASMEEAIENGVFDKPILWDGRAYRAIAASSSGVSLVERNFTYKGLLDHCRFADGSRCGMVVES